MELCYKDMWSKRYGHSVTKIVFHWGQFIVSKRLITKSGHKRVESVLRAIYIGYYMAARRYEISLRVLKNYFLSERSEQGKYYTRVFPYPDRARPVNNVFIFPLTIERNVQFMKKAGRLSAV